MTKSEMADLNVKSSASEVETFVTSYTESFVPRLRYSDELAVVEDAVMQNFSGKEVDVYRVITRKPPGAVDSIPQKKRDYNSGNKVLEHKVTAEEANVMTDKERFEYIISYALSVNQSSDKLEMTAKQAYKRVLKKRGLEAALEYADNRMGRYIQKFHLTPELGVISEFDKESGHASLLLFEGYTLNDVPMLEGNEKWIDYERDK